jgi:hypothetical protein
MANGRFQGVNYANTQQTIPELVEQGQFGGKIRRMFDKYILTADLASGDQILMGTPIQEGATLIGCIVSFDALGGSCTINVGWQAVAEIEPAGGDTLMTSNPTGFFSALPVSSAGSASAHGSAYEGGGNGVTASSFYQLFLTSPIQCVIAENAVSSGATGKALAMEVQYTIE